MNIPLLTLLLLCALLLTPLWVQLYRMARRRQRAPTTVPPEWHTDLMAHAPLYRRTPPALRRQAAQLAAEFIGQKHFVGCNGLVVTPVMQRVVAWQACLLVARHGLAPYAELASVLLYPGPFVVEQQHVDPAGVISADQAVLIGQAIGDMRVVLSWPDVLAAGAGSTGHNVVIHEFAHFLDHTLDGALSAPPSGSDWHDVLDHEYRLLRADVDAGIATLIDPYGSEDEVEFFAVASETFIELSRDMQLRHPRLYGLLARLYGIDPAAW